MGIRRFTPEQIRLRRNERSRQWRVTHPEENARLKKEWRLANPVKVKLHKLRYYGKEQNKIKHREAQRKYVSANKDKVRKAGAIYRLLHKEERRERRQERYFRNYFNKDYVMDAPYIVNRRELVNPSFVMEYQGKRKRDCIEGY